MLDGYHLLSLKKCAVNRFVYTLTEDKSQYPEMVVYA